jgi:aminoglycoside 3-N-acetyltransferase
MRPEPGDKTIEVRREDVCAGVRSVGVGASEDDVVMFHSSLSSLGNVIGGPNTVIDGFLDAVGPTGTVAVPTLWYHGTEPPMKIEDWDVNTSPSYPGVITETFRQRPDSLRSDNYSHSVSAIGARAVELTRTHGQSGLRPCVFGDGAFAADSPWEKFYQWNVAYCFLGVDFTVNTMGHYMECLVNERWLQRAPEAIRDQLDSELARRGKEGVYSGFNRQLSGERLQDLGLVAFGRIGSATIRCVRARVMVDTLMAMLEAEPEQWFTEGFQAWLARAKGEVQ